MPAPARGKDKQREHWNAVADGWAAWLDWTERNFAPITQWLAAAARWQPGARLLDVAGGSGYPALAAAASVRPGGRVVATDISSGMIDVASRRARTADLENIEFLEMDAEDLQFEEGSFDAVTNAYGLMFCPDPTRAAAEAYRVLSPGGRVAFVTWGDPSQCPFLTVIGRLASTFLSLPAPEPDAPGPFRLARPAQLETLLNASGFSEVRIDSRPITCECESVAEYMQIFSDLAWKSRMALLSEAESARFKEALADATQPYSSGGRLQLTATSLCASGRKPPEGLREKLATL